MYPKGTTFPVYCIDCYRSDKWDPYSLGLDIDVEKPFLEQFRDLKLQVPRAAVVYQGDLNGSEYCNRASYNKNCYLLVRANYNEDCRYSYTIWESRDSSDCFNLHKSELAYECLDTSDSYNVQYCQEIKQCRDSKFLFDCHNCTQCIGCVGLRSAQYHIFNKPYSKEEYEAKVGELKLDTVEGLRRFKEQYNEIVRGFIRESMVSTGSVDVSGNWLLNCKGLKDSYQCRDVENGRYLLTVVGGKDCMDLSYFGREVELVYETANCGYSSSRIKFANECWDSCSDLTYCDNCHSSSNLFGCVGIRKGEYSILNKQYSKEDYENIVPKIIEHMKKVPYIDSQGKGYQYGEFFPTEISPSPYNTTVAHEHFPLTQSEADENGFAWQDDEEKNYQYTKSWKDLPEDIASVEDSILQEVILCELWDTRGDRNVVAEHNCTKAFRITASELGFYRRMNIPLPRKCPNSRHFERFNKRNPLKLYPRQCQCAGAKSDNSVYSNTIEHTHHGENHCPNEFETSYAPGREEIVYCEQCYQQEVV